MKFRLIDTGSNTPAMNMAIDEALVDSEMPVLRFYRWQPAGLSLGYFQAMQQIDEKFCNEKSIEIVRRLTGGNAVLHDKELTYSLIIDEKEMPKDIIASYKKISKGILKALSLLNLDAEMNEDIQKTQKSAVCFNDPSWYEILVDGKKIVGSAQKRIRGKLLQHGAVLLDIDVRKYCRCFSGCNEKLISNTMKRVTSINNEIETNLSYGDIAEHMKKGFEEALGIEFLRSSLTDVESKKAKKLEKKYLSYSWNHKF